MENLATSFNLDRFTNAYDGYEAIRQIRSKIKESGLSVERLILTQFLI
ncbi:hypothetical protein [Aphanothece sacrum]|nr:hypothetical protein [Aphanothece sacrum]